MEMKNIVKRIIALILCMAFAAIIAACGSKAQPAAETQPETEVVATTEETTEETTKEETTEETTEEETTEEETTEEETLPEGNENLLTGTFDLADETVGLRPVAVAVNNVYEAMPQYGTSEADIVIEMPVEIGVTRLLCLYADIVNLPYIVSIRSYRYYFAPMALAFDAFYVHWGEDVSMLDYYHELEMDTYDGIYEDYIFGRDQERLNQQYNLEHTSCFYGDLFLGKVLEDGKRLELGDNYKDEAFKFNKTMKTVEPEGDDCDYLGIAWDTQWASFTYNEDDQTYYKTNYYDPQIDGVSGEQLHFTNVLALETDIWDRDDGYHVGLDWKGGKESVGYYISGGKIQKIHWIKEDEYSRLKLYDMYGNELSINRGKTYIGFCGYGSLTVRANVDVNTTGAAEPGSIEDIADYIMNNEEAKD